MILTMLASDRSTVTPLSPPPHQGANRRTRHHPPGEFRLLLNGLASSELRRVVCTQIHPRAVRFCFAPPITPRPVQHGGRVESDPVLHPTVRHCIALN